MSMSDDRCAALRERLPWYDTGRLSPEEHAAITRHLTTCAACRQELAQWRSIGKAVQRRFAQSQSAHAAQPLPDIERFRQLIATKGKPMLTDIQPPPPAAPPARRTPIRTPVPGKDPYPYRRWSVSLLVTLILLSAMIVAFFLQRTLGSGPGGGGNAVLPNIGLLSHITMVSPTEGWAIGMRDNLPPTPTPGITYDPPLVLHYTRGRWQVDDTIPPVTAATDHSIVSFDGIAMDSASDGWIVGSIRPDGGAGGVGQGVLLHYTQGHWINVSTTAASLSGVAMVSATDGWAVGDGVVLRYQNGAWTMVSAPTPGTSWQAVAATPEGGVWITGGSPSVIVHYDGKTWHQEPIDTPNPVLADIQMVSAAEGWAVGGHRSTGGSLILHYHNGSWQTQFSESGQTFFFGLSMISAADGWAVGYSGLIAHYTQGHWQYITSPTQLELLSVSMLSSQDGWATGAQGGVILRYQYGTWSVYHQ